VFTVPQYGHQAGRSLTAAGSPVGLNARVHGMYLILGSEHSVPEGVKAKLGLKVTQLKELNSHPVTH